MQSIHKAIGLGVVSTGSVKICPNRGRERVPQARRELGPLVGCDVMKDLKPGDPMEQQDISKEAAEVDCIDTLIIVKI